MSYENCLKPLEEICENLDRFRKPITKNKREKGPYPYYGASGIVDYVADYLFDEELLLVSEDGANLLDRTYPIAFSISGKNWVNNHVHVLRIENMTTQKYVEYYLNSIKLDPWVSGMAQPKLNQRNLNSIPVPIPPLPEQKRIVEILDEAFEAIEQAKSNIVQNIQNAEELFQSKLNEIFSHSGEGWEETKLKDITTKIGSGATPRGGKKNYKESGISLIRSLNVYDDGFKKENLAFIDYKQAEKLNNVEIQKGDVLLNITGASVARCCIVPDEFLPARVNQHVSIVRLSEKIMGERFLHFALISKPYKDLLLGIGEQGATRQAITKTQIQNFSISYPSDFAKQNELIESINEYKQVSVRLTERYEVKLKSMEELKKSILQKAFSGELTANEYVAV